MRSRLLLRVLLAALVASASPSMEDGGVEEELENENEMLKARLEQLEGQLKEEIKYSYVVVKGYIVDAEMIFMETMELGEAKQWCNANARCKGFTFGGPVESPEDEVTVTFKGGEDGAVLETQPDAESISYIKESATPFGAVGGAGLDASESHAVATQVVTFEAICFAFVLGIAAVVCRQRLRGRKARLAEKGLLPGPHAAGEPPR
jgi:hypothetical protein